MVRRRRGGGQFVGLKEKVMRGGELGFELGFLKLRREEGGTTDKDNGGGNGKKFVYLMDPDGFLFSNNFISSILAEIV